MKKILLPVIALGLTSALGFQIYRNISAVSQTAPGGRRPSPPIAVEAVPVRQSQLQSLLQLTGSTFPQAEFNVAPRVGGRVVKLLVDVGDAVRNGQVVALLDSEETQQQIARLQADMGVTQATRQEAQVALDIAKREYDRVKALHLKKFVPDAELDQARAAFESAQARLGVIQAQIKQKEAEIKVERVRLSYAQVRASWSQGGAVRRVSQKLVDEGATVSANTGLLAIVDINPIRALLEVTEKDYGRLRAGQLVGLKTDAFPERRFEGTVTRIAPVLKNTTRTAQVEVRVANPEGALKPGMFVRAELLLETRAKAQVVPLAAIVRKENEPPAVFLLNPDRESVRRVPVKLGISTQEVAEIVSPPLTGQVISLGSHLLDPKSKVSTGGKQRGEGKGEGKGGKPARGPKAPSDAPAAAKP